MALASTPTSQTGPEQAPTARIGMVLSGTYRLDAFLGQGMTGLTYNAWHLRQKQPFAVKLLHRELAPSHDRVSKLRQDLRALSGLRRFGFLPVDLSFAPDGAPFLAAELLVGETLRVRLQRGPLPVLAAGIVTAALARALAEAHKQNVVHGDLRPENVILPTEAGREIEAGQPVLLDGALHHLRKRAIGIDESLPLGKLAYLAPEQASGEQQTADVAGDIFALGAILYECLTGKQAFGGPELEVVLERLSSPPPTLQLPRELGAPPGMAEALNGVIHRACARSPEDRFAAMGELLEALGQAFEKSGLPLPPPDERVPIDTLLSQNKALRKRTVAVKRIAPVPTAPSDDDDVSDVSRVLTAAAMPSATSEPEPASDAPSKSSGKRNTAKQRIIRRTVRARDLSRMLAEVEAGRLSPDQAMAMSEADESDEEAESTKSQPLSEEQRLVEEGRAAVLARAEAAKKNREVEVQKRAERERTEAAQMQKRLLEQARAETLGRMRAEWEQSQRHKPGKDGADTGKVPKEMFAPQQTAAEQKELLEEAARQSKRLEAERQEAEKKAAEEAEREKKEALAAEEARVAAEKLQAELREKELLEAERAERVRQKAEREAEARKKAEEAELLRQQKLVEVEAAQKAAAEAKQQAEEAARQAEEAQRAQAQEAAKPIDLDAELLEDDIDEIFEVIKKPPPVPEAVKRAAEAAQKAQQQAAEAEAAAKKAKDDADVMSRAAQEAQQAASAAEESRVRSASEFEEIIRAAQEARDREEVLAKQIREAEDRARAAQVARAANLARATRATRALAVIQQVQTIAQSEPVGDEDEAKDGRSGGKDPSGPSMLTPSGRAKPAISESAVTPVRKPSETSGQELSSSYGAPKPVPPPRDPSGVFAPAQVPPMVRPEMMGSYTNPQMAPVGMRQDMSGVYTNPQMAPAMLSTSMPVLVTPVLQHQMPGSPHDYTLSRSQMATALGLTAILSGLIGSLGTLLLLRNQQGPSGTSLMGQVVSPDNRGVQPIQPPPGNLDGKPSVPSGEPAKQVAVAQKPESPPVDSVPVVKPAVRDAKTVYPPLRKLTDPATMPPKQSIWTRPAGAATATETAAAKTGDAKASVGADAKQVAGDAKSAADAKPAVLDNKTPVGAAKPAPDAKPQAPAAKPASDAKTQAPAAKTTDGLRNPFAM